MIRLLLLALAIGLGLAPIAARADDAGPDARGEAWGGDRHAGTTARVLIPLPLRQRNTGGSDGAGLCVIASMKTAGNVQGLADEVAALWEAAKRLPGGYSPQKLERLVADVAPSLKYVSYVGTDTEVVERLVRSGRPVGTTMNTGRLYGYRPIHHMVTTVHLDDRVAALIDNNKPEVTVWIPRAEYDRRFVDGPSGWAFAWEALPIAARLSLPLLILLGVAIGAALRAHADRRREDEE